MRNKWMRGAVVGLVLAGSCAMGLEGQVVDHWDTQGECEAAVNAPYYYPDEEREVPLAPGEFRRGFNTALCVEMDLPDRLNASGGRDYVRTEAGRAFVVDSMGNILRLAECNNRVYSAVALPERTLLAQADTVVYLHYHEGEVGLRVSGEVELRERLREQFVIDEPSWFSRNWLWSVPLGVAVIAGGVAAWCEWGHPYDCGPPPPPPPPAYPNVNVNQEQETTYVGSPLRGGGWTFGIVRSFSFP